MIKLFIDDMRRPPDTTWELVRTVADAIEFISINGCPNIISFDYCLENGLTTMPFVEYLIAEDKKTNGQFFPADFKYFIHSSSIYGRELIFKTLNDYLMDKQT